jgi:hypothetical protein
LALSFPFSSLTIPFERMAASSLPWRSLMMPSSFPAASSFARRSEISRACPSLFWRNCSRSAAALRSSTTSASRRVTFNFWRSAYSFSSLSGSSSTPAVGAGGAAGFAGGAATTAFRTSEALRGSLAGAAFGATVVGRAGGAGALGAAGGGAAAGLMSMRVESVGWLIAGKSPDPMA